MQPSPQNFHFGILVARFNELVTKSLYQGAYDTLRRYGIPESHIETFSVPGAFELPGLAAKLAKGQRFHALIAIGSVIKGSTDHYDYICSASLSGLNQVSVTYALPVLCAVLTTHTLEQALERAGGKEGNKGAEAALGAIEMARLYSSCVQ